MISLHLKNCDKPTKEFIIALHRRLEKTTALVFIMGTGLGKSSS